MNKNCRYWIKIDSWNLIESFVTECISPSDFYRTRGFGNNLSRYISKGGDTINHLLLSTIPPNSDYSIEVSDEIIDKDQLHIVDKKDNCLFSYPKTIYYKKGFTKFRFRNDSILKGLVAESKILFEVKCIEKYINDFYVDEKSDYEIKIIPNSEIGFDNHMFCSLDKKYNYIKGAIIGYARGQMTNMSNQQQDLQTFIIDLKNSFAGLYTQLMMSEDCINDALIISMIMKCKNSCKDIFLNAVNPFDIIKQIYSEIIYLSSLRSKELNNQKTPQYIAKLDNLKTLKISVENKLNIINDNYEINELNNELKQIIKLEAENGEKIGKQYLRFKKGSYEYNRKKEIKEIVASFKKENKEYKELKSELRDLEHQIANYRYGTTEYDSTIGALFIKISDSINEISRSINANNKISNVDLSKICFLENSLSFEQIDNMNSEEVAYLNILLQTILERPIVDGRLISENDIKYIIEISTKSFNNTDAVKTEIGKQIKDTLLRYWRYKYDNAESFNIPDNLPILQSIMAFFIKAQGFDQIERFILNRKYKYKQYAFMLWGALIGFSAIPKTFTSIIYANNKSDEAIDVYLYKILNEIYNFK